MASFIEESEFSSLFGLLPSSKLCLYSIEIPMDLSKQMAYNFPPKDAEKAILFKPEFPMTLEEKGKFEQELEEEMHGFSEKYPLVASYCGHRDSRYNNAKYEIARYELLKIKTESVKRFGVQFIASHFNYCRNIHEKEILIHDEMGEYVKVLYGKVSNLYEYETCLDNKCYRHACRISNPILPEPETTLHSS
jgi:hypothetical protein